MVALARSSTPFFCDDSPHVERAPDEHLGYQAAGAVPGEYDRSDMRRVGRQIGQPNVERMGRRLNLVRFGAAEVVQDNDDGWGFGIGFANLLKDGHDRLLRRIGEEIVDAVAHQAVDAHRVGLATRGALGDIGRSDTPNRILLAVVWGLLSSMKPTGISSGLSSWAARRR